MSVHAVSTDPLVPVHELDPAARVARAREALRRAEEHTGARTLSIVAAAAPVSAAHPRTSAPAAPVPDPTTGRPAPASPPATSSPATREVATREVALTSDERPALPVPAQLRPLIPEGLRRGSAAVVTGSTSLLLAMLAEVSHEEGWVAVVGAPAIGLVAADQMGVRLDRLVLVPRPGAESATVVAALLDGMDIVVVGPDAALLDSDRRRLSARARERASVIIATTAWQGAHLVLTTEHSQWSGLGRGAGRLRARRLTVGRSGRGTGTQQRLDVCFPVGDAGAATVQRGVTVPSASVGHARLVGPGLASTA